MKFLAGVIGGLVLAILSMILVSIGGAGSPPAGNTIGPTVFFLVWIASIVIALAAPRAAKAWRRLLLLSGIVSFLMPLAGVVFTGSFLANQQTSSAAETAGAAVGGTLVTGALGFVGFFLGVVFVLSGLLVGRDKQVIYVNAPQPPQNP